MTLVFVIFLGIKEYTKKNLENSEMIITPSVDIINPNFTINNKNKKIFVKAAKGNFIGSDLILLEDNVYFESSDFKIFSDIVTFNRKEETANSKTKSIFESEGTTIVSEGFQITDKGDTIFFDGDTSLIIE